ncbi:MAG: DUF1492 domain-containing protein [Lachnospiraceae bacterium]|nr:DUF1492 domain-containing protein [Lachnospiraceae bacterium]
MKTREYLQQIERYDLIIRNRIVEIERLDELIRTVPALPYDKDKIISSGDQDHLGASVAKLLDDKRELEEFMAECMEKRKRIIEQIESLSTTKYVRILSMRYLDYKELYKVASELGYSYSQVKNFHRDALVEFENLYEPEYRYKKSVMKIDPD